MPSGGPSGVEGSVLTSSVSLVGVVKDGVKTLSHGGNPGLDCRFSLLTGTPDPIGTDERELRSMMV